MTHGPVHTPDAAYLEHLAMQAAAQDYVDSSISKTINLPKDISFEAFKHVYEQAFAEGCKGCTTYRPSGVRGSILSTASDGQDAAASAIPGALAPPRRHARRRKRPSPMRWKP